MNQTQQSGGLDQNIAGALSYIFFVVAIVWLVIEPFKNNKFIRFHAFQSLFLAAASVVFFIGGSIVLGILPVVGALIGLLVIPLGSLAFFVIWIICIIKAYQNEEYKLPIIGKLAAEQAAKTA